MADFVLIIPRIRQRHSKTAVPPFVFLQLAAALEKENFTSELIDTRVENDYLERIKRALRSNPLFIGITSLTGFQSAEGLKIARFIKDINKKVPIVWGGVHASFFPEQVLDNEYTDAAVIGEGESTVVSLAKEYKLRGKLSSKIRGVAIKENGSIRKNPSDDFLDLNSLPMPAWHLIKDKIQYYSLENGKQLDIITSRGCPHNCYFCYNLNYNKCRFRSRSAEKVLNEIDFLHREYGIERIGFSDDNFMTDRNRVIKICEGLRKNRNITDLHCDVRIDYIDDNFMSYLTGHGFRTFYLGVESGSQKLLDLINKKTTVEKIKEGISTLSKYTSGGHTYSLMIGLPDETKEDIKDTWELARWIFNIDNKAQILLSVYTPYPGTELVNMLIRKGYKMPDNLLAWHKYNFFSVERKEWINNARSVRSLVAIFRFAFTRSNNQLACFLSSYAKKVFLTGKLKPYLEFEFLNYLFRNF